MLPSPLCAGGERNKQGTGAHWRNSFLLLSKTQEKFSREPHIFLDLVLAHQIGSELVVCSSALSHSHLPQPEWKVDSTYRSTDMCLKLEKSNLGSRKSSSGSISGCLKSIVRRTCHKFVFYFSDVISLNDCKCETGNLSSSTFIFQLVLERVVPNCEFVLPPLKYFK